MYEGNHTPIYCCSNSKHMHKKLKYYREEYFDNTFANILETIHLQKGHIERLRFLASNYLKEFSEYEKRTTEEKKLIVTTMTNSIKFDGENLIVDLKDTFKAL